MEKNIKDYLHLYLGCEAMHGEKRVIVCGLNINSYYIQNILSEDTIKMEDIKLLLRPLSDMTEEEGLEIAVMFFKDCDVSKVKFTHESSFKRVKYHNAFLNFPDTYYTPEIFRHLLSKGFDLFGLIEAGLAIDKTKLTVTNPL